MKIDNEDYARVNSSFKRQQEILKAAIKVFSRKGFNGATTKEIAKEAGIAEGTIFRYFKTKKDILLGIADPCILETLNQTIEKGSGKKDDDLLKSIIKNRLEIMEDNTDLIRLFFTEAQFHPELREMFVENIVMKAASIVENAIRERIEKGEYKDINPNIAVRALAGMVIVFVLWKHYMFGEKFISFDEDEVIESVVEIFLNGIRK